MEICFTQLDFGDNLQWKKERDCRRHLVLDISALATEMGLKMTWSGSKIEGTERRR
jgi:hypothetical protein